MRLDESKRTIHIWSQFSNAYDIYLLNSRQSVVTLNDLKNENATRWVEIPHDFERLMTLDKLIKNKRQYIEINESDPSDDSDDDNDDNDDNDEEILTICIEYFNKQDKTWPLMKQENDWTKFEIGDIIDIRDIQQQWNQAFIRNIIFVQDKDSQSQNSNSNVNTIQRKIESLVVHSIGWHPKWVENIRIDSKDLAMRLQSCSGPYCPGKWIAGSGRKPPPLFQLPVTGIQKFNQTK